MSVTALCHPYRERDLLAYSSIITKAAYDFEGTPWLSYDAHFCNLAATIQLQTWGQVDQSLWSQNFSWATLYQANRGALSIGPYGSQDSELSKSAKGAPVKPSLAPSSQRAYSLAQRAFVQLCHIL